MRFKQKFPVSGDLLVSDFQTVLTGIAMSQYAAHEAERSETQLMDQLASLGNSGYLSPEVITDSDQTDITRGSLDVHVKKVQAQQLANLSAQQLAQLIEQTRSNYVGRRITVVPVDRKTSSIEAVWFDQQTGYRTTAIRKQRVVGVVEDVRLDENMLILRPSLQRRLMTPGLQNYVVYVINPPDLVPLVRLQVT